MMASKICVLLLCVWSFLGDQVPFVVSRELLSNEEDAELENEVMLLNKSALTTISTRYGEEYDCIDFYTQRAFDHPTLKGHNFHPEMRPRSYRAKKLHKYSSRTNLSFNDIWLNGRGCPIGYVPVKRITKDDLIRIKQAEKIYAQTYEPTTVGQHGTHYAVLHTNRGTQTKLYGAGMRTSVYNPHVSGSQYSSSQVKLSNGVDIIEAGWTVNPLLYNDNETRLFIYTKTRAIHCLNTHCPGFVSVREDYALGSRISPISQSGGAVFEVKVLIKKNGRNWELQVGPTSTSTVTIGFWPESIFTGLKEFANYAEWGGKVYSPPNVPSPPMGAGAEKLRLSTAYDAYCKEIETIDQFHNSIVARDTSTYADIKHYKVEDFGINKFIDGHVIVFGGPSGYIGN